MKKQFILSLLLLSVVTAGGKTIHKVSNPEYVAMQQGTMEIVSVKTTEEATTITFKYLGEGFHQFVPDIHLVDEQDKHYELIGQKGFSEDSLKNLKPKKKGKYELRFKPLPTETRIFDLIEDAYYMGATRYYGIREKGAPFTVSNPLPHNEGNASLPDIDFKVDSTIVTGHIVGYNPEESTLKGIVFSQPSYSFRTSIERPSAKFDKDGNFQMKLSVCGPTWTHLVVSPSGMFVPVMLYPGDSIHLNIDLEAENRITYNSQKQKDFSKLMQCAPIMSTFHNVLEQDTLHYHRLTSESVNKRFEDYDELSLYLSGKYGLNRVETEMLRSHLSTMIAIDVAAITSYYLFKKYPRPTSNDEVWEWKKVESSYFNSIGKVRAESNAFLTTPNWSELLSTHHLFENPQFFTLFYNSLENVYTENSEDAYTIKDLLNTILKRLREYRQKGDDDSIFEQAFLLCFSSALPVNIPTTENQLTRISNNFNQYRQLFFHPSVVRMVGTIINEWEQKAYQELEEQEYRNSLNKKQ